MTEAEWLTAEDPRAMLDSLKGLASDRKLRLLVCGYCRGVWNQLNAHRARRAVEIGELYADGLVSEADLNPARSQAGEAASRAAFRHAGGRFLGNYYGYPDEVVRLWIASEAAFSHTPFPIGRLKGWADYRDFYDIAPSVLRCLFGNPFHPVAVEPAWLTSTVVGLAEGIYAERAFDRLPILADALQDAGCESESVLAHCRGDGPHARGCWVVDLVLGKQ